MVHSQIHFFNQIPSLKIVKNFLKSKLHFQIIKYDLIINHVDGGTQEVIPR